MRRRTNALLVRYFVGLAGLMNPADGVEQRSSAMYEVRAGSPVTVMLYMGLGWASSCDRVGSCGRSTHDAEGCDGRAVARDINPILGSLF
ncbi:MAG: hypothetical protein ABIQ16_03520 [Polyangiaceae bacterium]